LTPWRLKNIILHRGRKSNTVEITIGVQMSLRHTQSFQRYLIRRAQNCDIGDRCSTREAILMRSFVLLIIAAIAWSSVASSQAKPDETDLGLEKSFVYSDLVVDGVVEKITTVKMPHGDFVPGAAGPNIPVAIIFFKVNRVLLGYPQPDRIEIHAIISKTDHNYFDLAEGDRYVLSLHYGGGKCFSGKYISRMTHERFFIEDSRWFQGRKDRPIAEGDVQGLYAAIEQAAAERSFEVLTRRADLIVRGKVVAITGADGSMSEKDESGIQRVTLAIQSVVKGVVEDDSLVLSLQTKYGVRRLSWGVLVPSMHVGEEWIAFLKYADDPGYYPFAGVNGLFLVKGDSVIRDNWNEMVTGSSLRQMELDLRRMAAQGE
jgi:hypothetical protein